MSKFGREKNYLKNVNFAPFCIDSDAWHRDIDIWKLKRLDQIKHARKKKQFLPQILPIIRYVSFCRRFGFLRHVDFHIGSAILETHHISDPSYFKCEIRLRIQNQQYRQRCRVQRKIAEKIRCCAERLARCRAYQTLHEYSLIFGSAISQRGLEWLPVRRVRLPNGNDLKKLKTRLG